MAHTLVQGGNVSLAALAPGASRILVGVGWAPERIGDLEVDASAFLLQENAKVRSDADFVFYNQPRSAEGSVATQRGERPDLQRFDVDMARIPPAVDRIAFAATIHDASGRGTSFAMASAAWIRLLDPASGRDLVRFEAATAGRAEAALILGELYRRGSDWKFRAVGQGFAGGLAPLARHFGVVIEEPVPTPAQPAPLPRPDGRKATLEKRIIDLAKRDPGLVSLVKKARIELEKKNLGTERAKVALALDISGSMSGFYRSGSIATLVARVLALGFNFDDDGAIDVFLFGANAYSYGPLGVDTYRDFVPEMLRRYGLEGATCYGAVMGVLRQHYRAQPDFGTLPIYVMFVTDGDTSDKARTENEIRAAAGEPFFWQFMAIGKKKTGLFGRIAGAGFDFLERLDSLPGRIVDNADFFLVEDPSGMPEETLYRLLTTEYPNWLRLVREQGILGCHA